MGSRLRRIIGTLTPVGWVASAVAVIVAVIVVSVVWGRIWSGLPWSAAARAERAEVTARAAQSDSAARTLEVEGQAVMAGRVDTFHHQTLTIRTATAEAVAQARSAPDAHDPLDIDRADRLRRLDRQLCDIRPAVCEAPATDAPR